MYFEKGEIIILTTVMKKKQNRRVYNVLMNGMSREKRKEKKVAFLKVQRNERASDGRWRPELWVWVKTRGRS
jgi:hypothetical protein